jgi:hypothetical protein
MPPLASLAASLLVASPPLAACGPPARFRHGGGGPAYPQPILSLPSAYPRILSHPARGDGGGGDAAAGVLCSMLIVPLGLRAPHTHSWPRRPWRPAPPHTASQAKPVARSRVEPPGAVPLGAAAAPPSARGQKRSREEDTQDAETAAQGPTAKVCRMRASAVGALRPSAYPQPTLSLPSAYPPILSHPARGDGGGGGDAAAGELGG